MSTTQPDPRSPWLRALRAAHALGRADGLAAVELGLVQEPTAVERWPATGAWCHGLAPVDLARLVWGAGAGSPPAGLELNAPLWYAQGFRDVTSGAGAPRGRAAGEDAQAEHWHLPARQ